MPFCPITRRVRFSIETRNGGHFNMLKIFNTLTGKKEPLRNADVMMPTAAAAARVGLYVCGMTVYDHCHLGHARSAIVFDVIRNDLEYRNINVLYVKNFTDVDDKIIHRAQTENRNWRALAEEYIASYEDDMQRLNVRPPTLTPKATEHISEMITLIEGLIAKGMAYDINGDVYFDVAGYPAYGQLSKQKIGEMASGYRIQPDEKKKSPLDFALWKKVKPGEPSWESPWGLGRPGWHIECSAMAIKHLGADIDIHGGGLDLIFPHHENEIAQSEAFTGKRFAATWMHHGMVTLHHEKMSKSLGNFFTIKEIFQRYPQDYRPVVSEVIRFFLLSTHYRSPIDFSDEALMNAWAGLDRFYELFAKWDEQDGGSPCRSSSPIFGEGLRVRDDVHSNIRSFYGRIEAAMDDDFNTPKAISVLQGLRATINRRMSNPKTPWIGSDLEELKRLFGTFGKVLGLFQVPPLEWRSSPRAANGPAALWPVNSSGASSAEVRPDLEMPAASPERRSPPVDAPSAEEVRQKVLEREAARRNGDWALSDQIRLELKKAGILLEDRPDGTTRVKR
jgi:cysteinyl-tRNA synthetase